MARSTSPLLLLTTLGVGVILGLELNRGGRFVRAQVGQLPLSATSATSASQPVLPASIGKPQGEDAIYQQLAQQYAKFDPINRTFELVARAVSPSVVHLVTHKTGRREDDDQVRDFEETGSGVIVRMDGSRGLYVLTNNHVVSDATVGAISIQLSDGRSVHPVRMWADSKADIAVLKLDRTDLPAARLGNSDDVAVGSWVMAMGSPFGLTHSVSQGIISGRGRHEVDLERAGVENQNFLQTDAAINPGNSGGPLVNMKGEVIGINIAILSNGGGNEGVGFSIPINVARWIMGQLLANGRVNRGALGIKLQPDFVSEKAIDLGLDRPRGALIDSVDDQSPAALGGVRIGDVILRFNGVEVIDLNHLINLVSMAPIGQKADVVVWRDRREHRFDILVADKDRIVVQANRTNRPSSSHTARRPERIEAVSSSAQGMELVTLDGSATRRMGLPDGLRGAAVTKIEPDSPLANYFRPLDVIYSISGEAITTADQAIRYLGDRSTKPAEFSVHRLVDGNFERIKVRLP
ncbi:trypsin-like peptidase domain-containing protein [Tundrisphaera sp. TA3]|uniref:trypsin-like peptidase domain-containing protein n=1 Tax=Tundrisphaera sp. TA3 TaxID=3435775 RepID=UPI003EC0B7D8